MDMQPLKKAAVIHGQVDNKNNDINTILEGFLRGLNNDRNVTDVNISAPSLTNSPHGILAAVTITWTICTHY